MADERRGTESSTKNDAAAASAAEAPPSVDQRIAELEAALKAKTEEAASLQDRYLREVAEGENFKKRQLRDKGEAVRYANESILRDILPVIDNLELALEHADLGGNGKSVVEGVELVLRLFRDLLERHGVREVGDPVGSRLDPATQEATSVEPKEGVQANTVIRQLQKGYRYHDRLLRPARVVVARGERDEGNSAH